LVYFVKRINLVIRYSLLEFAQCFFTSSIKTLVVGALTGRS